MFQTTRYLKFGDCDPSGIAYFPSYLDHLVGVLEEFFATAGVPWPTLIQERRIGVPTVKLDLTFSKPGFHGDRLDFAVRLKRIGTSSMDLEHEVSANGALLWRADHRIVATSHDTHRACPWPDDIRSAFMPYLETQDA
ncbi:acyl-CoA thioesterase [Rhizobium sp. NRK18]|uniref:acyl-CoA thioesterase n=1 Tax=Rhizobium sp. NRK18 TaxID=2964667 RepID=UPI0021C38CB8|nr:thioesterase family protein [Rhizobium sp. NRK18]MCQ2003250.1 acyl-CoA thioesterase [Rhizobium sp. NRK18]